MLTKEQIKKNLQNDPYWEPEEDASWEDWDLFDEVSAELEGEEGTSTEETDDEPKETGGLNDDDDFMDDDEDW